MKLLQPIPVWFVLFLGLLASLILPARPLSASGRAQQAVWPQVTLVPVATDLNSPVYVTHAGDGSGRLFIVQQSGQVLVTGMVGAQPTTFLDISDLVLFSGEQGLLSAAFPPGYAQKGYFYVYYTQKNGDNVVSRFHVSGNGTADPRSEEKILPLQHPIEVNHNGGQLQFGPDGYLYIGTGDGGGQGDPNGNALNPLSLLGKLLRIDPEFTPGPPITGTHLLYLPQVASTAQVTSGGPAAEPLYRIPTDNPYYNVRGYQQEIWALGLRNPWRFSFDRQTGDLYIGDVGQGSQEEIDFQPASSPGGENYGWNIMEGTECYGGGTSCDKTGLTLPVYTYPTHGGDDCAVTGGYVYRGAAYPAMQGIYFFADYCGGELRGLQNEGGTWQYHQFTDTAYQISSFGEDEAGGLYLTDIGGTVYRLEAAAK